MNLTEKALHLAARAHEGQMRKEGGLPYIIHPVMVAFILERHGFDEQTVAAALVHDVLEDTETSAEELGQELGSGVRSAVEALTYDKNLPWKEQRLRYIESVRASDTAVKAICTVDKIHNAQSLLASHEKEGKEVWKYFTRGKEEKLWFEEEVLKMLKESWDHPLIGEYAGLIARMRKLDA